MFRLLPRGLPRDPEYPTNLEHLGYFINDDDEIRNIEDPKYYFKYFINRCDRYNERQRESMNTAIRSIVSGRLAFHGMETHCLPLGTTPTDPHIPILASANIDTASRVVILFGEATQDLGTFALRIINGHGGINVGSAIDFVKYVQSQRSADGGDAPGIILANCGQLRWNRCQGKAMTRLSWDALPRPSAVHEAILYDPVANTVEHNRTQKEHIAYVLSTVVPSLCKEAKVNVIAIADSARYVSEFLDENWDVVKGRMESLALVFPYHGHDTFQNGEFKDWLRKRARGYIMAESTAGMGIFGPLGGTEAWQRGYGMNTYGLPDEVAEESVFPRHFRKIVDWMQEVAQDPEYVNEEIVAVEMEKVEEKNEEVQWVGAEYWETEEGKSQLARDGMADGAVQVMGGEDTEEGTVKSESEKGDTEKGTVQSEKETGRSGEYAAKEKQFSTAPSGKEEGTANVKALGLDGAADEMDMSIPPEHMEQLPSYVKTDEKEPEVKLSKEEKAAILQVTVLSSPIRETEEKRVSGGLGPVGKVEETKDKDGQL